MCLALLEIQSWMCCYFDMDDYVIPALPRSCSFSPPSPYSPSPSRPPLSALVPPTPPFPLFALPPFSPPPPLPNAFSLPPSTHLLRPSFSPFPPPGGYPVLDALLPICDYVGACRLSTACSRGSIRRKHHIHCSGLSGPLGISGAGQCQHQ